ncbi:hypothetical protein ACFOLJ_23385 [Rugamonas sp. CCM 8940]|uniref:hypothetical protein n=1 Tax=Rugamonas sp. CCM 8940 TaxID=2765359 RepID=UPI0018F6045E|nr:hypothetical protein [Rugamonas sp. CCM 8940]MBJ7311089.1 hypothetical protein [Rugamonas sp. CCM 8940]
MLRPLYDYEKSDDATTILTQGATERHPFENRGDYDSDDLIANGLPPDAQFIDTPVDRDGRPIKASPHLTLSDVGDFFSGKAQSTAKSFKEFFTDDLPNLPSAIVDFAKHPLDTLERGGLALQDNARKAALDARDGNFRTAGELEGKMLGKTVAGAAFGTIAGSAIGYGVDYLGVRSGFAIPTPYGLAWQSLNPEALILRQTINSGSSVFRAGTTGFSDAVEGQFWAMENPLTAPNYAARYGIPPQNIDRLNFVERGVVRTDNPFISKRSMNHNLVAWP